MPNDFFDSTRFLHYFTKLWTEQRHAMLISAVIVLGIMLIMEVWVCLVAYDFSYYTDGMHPKEDPVRGTLQICSWLLLFVGGCVSATRFFTDGQQKAGRVHVLTMPVSMFENWLARMILFVVSYIVIFHVVFYGLEIIRWFLLTPVFPKIDIAVQHLFMCPDTTGEWGWTLVYTTVWYFFTVSLFVLGSLVFPRKPLLSTTISVFILGLVGFLIPLFSGFEFNVGFGWLTLWIGMLSLLNYWLSYRRLCELEVIDRM